MIVRFGKISIVIMLLISVIMSGLPVGQSAHNATFITFGVEGATPVAVDIGGGFTSTVPPQGSVHVDSVTSTHFIGCHVKEQGTAPEFNRILLTESKDIGKTWTSEIFANDASTESNANCKIKAFDEDIWYFAYINATYTDVNKETVNTNSYAIKLYKTTNGGLSWSLKQILGGPGNTTIEHLQLAVSPDDSNFVIVGWVCRGVSCPNVNGGNKDGYLAISENGMTSYREVVLSSGSGHVEFSDKDSMVIAQSKDIYVTNPIGTNAKFWRSTDNGATFSTVANDAQGVKPVEIAIPPNQNLTVWWGGNSGILIEKTVTAITTFASSLTNQLGSTTVEHSISSNSVDSLGILITQNVNYDHMCPTGLVSGPRIIIKNFTTATYVAYCFEAPTGTIGQEAHSLAPSGINGYVGLVWMSGADGTGGIYAVRIEPTIDVAKAIGGFGDITDVSTDWAWLDEPKIWVLDPQAGAVTKFESDLGTGSAVTRCPASEGLLEVGDVGERGLDVFSDSQHGRAVSWCFDSNGATTFTSYNPNSLAVTVEHGFDILFGQEFETFQPRSVKACSRIMVTAQGDVSPTSSDWSAFGVNFDKEEFVADVFGGQIFTDSDRASAIDYWDCATRVFVANTQTFISNTNTGTIIRGDIFGDGAAVHNGTFWVSRNDDDKIRKYFLNEVLESVTLQSTFDSGIDMTAVKNLKVTKDGAYLFAWNGTIVKFWDSQTDSNLFTIETNLTGIRDADVDFLNNYLYVGNATTLLRYDIYNLTVSVAGDSPLGQKNPAPTQTSLGQGAFVDPGADDTIQIGTTEGTKQLFNVDGGSDIFGETAFGGMIGIFMVFGFAGAAFMTTGSWQLGVGGGFLGMLLAFFFGFIPLWFPVVVGLFSGAIIIMRFSKGG